ncbi:MAG: cytochrome C biogenesis protein [Leifsonia sp.]|nr:cytochrome C biogenesis protein [Leifsonia sp.]
MEPLRPSDHYDSRPPSTSVAQPALGVRGWIRFSWRQLTSMRTALLLLLMLSVAAIPGSLVPQRSADPNGVVQFERANPEAFAVLDTLQAFDTYTSVWFSAIYLLLFVSLIGCIIPRARHHWRALLSRPPATPGRLSRMVGFTERVALQSTVETELDSAHTLLRRQRYRVERYGDSLSAERGYWRETGNLVFHAALVGVLATVGFAGGFGYNGQKVIVEGQVFTNQLTSFDSFSPGRFFDESRLDPYSIRLDAFVPEYQPDPTTGFPQALDYTAYVTVVEDGKTDSRQIKVNEPIDIDGATAYLLGNGFAPWITVYDPNDSPVFSQPVAFLPQDSNLGSLGVVKVPDGLDQQLGMRGFFYPSAVQLESGALSSVYPEPDRPVLTLNAYVGDLGLNEGVPRNAYALNTDGLTQITGGETDAPPIVLGLGQSAELPEGLGSVEFTSLPRFASIEVHHDPTQMGVLVSTILVVVGLLLSLFIPRRRLWVAATAEGDGVRLQYAGLARGEDPQLKNAVAEFARAHGGESGGARPHQQGGGARQS